MLDIPFSGAAKENLDINLGGQELTLSVRYASISDSWAMDVLDRSVNPSTPLLTGVRIVVGVDMLAPYALELGSLYAINLTSPGNDPGREDLGSAVRVVYLTEAEAAGLS